ncbi:MAG: gamma-glutamyl-gamma-aminobutyrate hydrolase family protein [Chloroflexota bacterium]|nr:gamma-glutamyl-gamma-aminobutyrate hydrolase family protein [Chloroflexota bacterium]
METRTPLIGISCGTVTAKDGSPHYGHRQNYVQAVQQAGAAVVLVPPGGLDSAVELLERLDALLLPGGADVDPACYGEPPSTHLGSIDPELDALDMRLVREAAAHRKPLLGICRGQQAINVGLGGSLYQDIESEYDTPIQHRTPSAKGGDFLAHTIRIEPASVLSAMVGATELEVNSSHHQAVKRVAPRLRITATSPDGIIEGLESADGLVVTVQCHPERLSTDWARRFFVEFVRMAARGRAP